MKKIAVIGYGGQGRWHCEQIRASDVVSFAGTYDVKPARCELARREGAFVYESVEALLSDPSVDIVVIATPNDSHRELAIRAFEAGKHVICEKPVTVSVAALDEMIAAAEKNGRFFTVHQNRRWDVDYLAVKQVIESGEIGDVIRIESRIHGSHGIPGDWRCTKACGGGMMLDWGVHLIDQMLTLLSQKIVRVYCETTHITHDEVDDGFRLDLTFEDGKSVLVEVGTYQFLSLPRLYLQCKAGTLLIPGWNDKVKIVRLKTWEEANLAPVQVVAGLSRTMAPRDEITVERFERDLPTSDVHDFYRNVCAVLDGTAEPAIKLAEVRRVMQVMEAALASAKQHQVLTVSL